MINMKPLAVLTPPSICHDIKYSHRLQAVIKTSTQEESNIFITRVYTLQYFIKLDIENISDKINTLIQEFTLFTYSDTPD